MTRSGTKATRLVCTDAGIDDAFALIFIGHFLSGGPDLIVCNGGNVRLGLVANNCAYLKRMFGWNSELYLGSSPSIQPLTDAAEVHGRWGLGERRAEGVELPSLERLGDRLEGLEGPLEVLVLGSCTDVPRLLSRKQVAARVENLVVMGGAFDVGGNVTPHAEFNVMMDPGAAQKTMEAEGEFLWVPLDATEGHLYSAEDALGGVGQREQGRLVRELFEFCADAHRELAAGNGVYMHDVIAAAVWLGLVEATVWTTRLERIVAAGQERGRIVHRPEGDGPAVRYASGVDHEAFLGRWREVCEEL